MIRSLRGHKSNLKSLILMTSLVIQFLLKSHQHVVFFHPPTNRPFLSADGLTLFIQCLHSEVPRAWQFYCSVSSWPCRIGITWSLLCCISAHHKHSTSESGAFPNPQVTWWTLDFEKHWPASGTRAKPPERQVIGSVCSCKSLITITWDRRKSLLSSLPYVFQIRSHFFT